jgi:hypothetical protein
MAMNSRARFHQQKIESVARIERRKRTFWYGQHGTNKQTSLRRAA